MRNLCVVLFALIALMGGLGVARADEDKGEVKLVYVEWDCATATTHIMKTILEDLGYTVQATPVGAAAMWQSIATGNQDAMLTAWLPTTHGTYLERIEDQVEDLGPNLLGTRIGLVVPAYVEINSIEELGENAELFNGRIIGIDPGAGLMVKTEKVLEEYDLDGIELVEGSGATMTAALNAAIRREQPIVVTGWTPHWKFGRWELKYLEDPKNVYGGAESIHTIVRKGLEEDMPEVYALLNRFAWTPEMLAEAMDMNQADGTTPEQGARKWIEKHPEQVATWLGQENAGDEEPEEASVEE